MALSLEQRQRQVLAPQMTRNLALLQASVPALAEMILAEADVNPALSIEDSGENSLDAMRADSGRRDEFDSGDKDRDPGFEDYLYSGMDSPDADPDADEKRKFFLDSIPDRESLQEHLLAQLGETDLAGKDVDLAREIIGSIDDNGYLASPPAEIAQAQWRSLDDVQRVLDVVRTFTPPGVGALNLRDCLALQIKASGDESRAASVALAVLADERAFADLAARRFDDLEKYGNATECLGALECIRRCKPHPGLDFSRNDEVTVSPDASVFERGGKWVAALDDSALPKAGLSKTCLRQYEELTKKIAEKRALPQDAEAEKWLKEKIKAAEELLAGVSLRQQTLSKIIDAVVARQQEFFTEGSSALKPLTMTDVATELGMHESTVSRAVEGKYLRAPGGLVKLRSLFTNALPAGGDGEVASDAVREKIRELIADEDPAKPLSDQKIADTLKKQGVEVARRTVAKYREQLRIPSTSERKAR